MELRPSHKHAVPHVAERLAHLTLELFARFWRDRTNTDTDVDWCVYNKKKNLSYHVTITAGGHESHTEPGPCSAWWKPSARQSSR